MLVKTDMDITTCTSSASAVAVLKSRARCDVIILDHNSANGGSLEILNLTRGIRQLPGRKRTPIIMLSGNDCEDAGWGAGIDAFLRKPEQVGDLPSMITRLLGDRTRKK